MNVGGFLQGRRDEFQFHRSSPDGYDFLWERSIPSFVKDLGEQRQGFDLSGSPGGFPVEKCLY